MTMTSAFGSTNTSAGLLEGRIVLVTGAAGTIGRAVCAALSEHAAQVVKLDRVAVSGTIACDVTDPSALAAYFDALDPPVTDVVHAAGSLIVGPIAKTELADYRLAIDANLTSAFLVGREAARRLKSGGTLTFVSSQGGLKAGAQWGIYCAAKAGVIRLAEALAQELGGSGVRVNCVCPGTVESPMTDRAIDNLAQWRGGDAASIKARYAAGVPLGRFAYPSEIGRTCVYLISPLASYVSGVALLVDGGELSG